MTETETEASTGQVPNAKREAIGRVKARVDEAVAVMGDSDAPASPGTGSVLARGFTGFQSPLGSHASVSAGLVDAWTSPAASGIALDIDGDVGTVRTKLESVQEVVRSAYDSAPEMVDADTPEARWGSWTTAGASMY